MKLGDQMHLEKNSSGTSMEATSGERRRRESNQLFSEKTGICTVCKQQINRERHVRKERFFFSHLLYVVHLRDLLQEVPDVHEYPPPVERPPAVAKGPGKVGLAQVEGAAEEVGSVVGVRRGQAGIF